MSVAWFTSPGIDRQFTYCGHIGRGHPDPDIGYAEGNFYLITQTESDYISSGPWVGRIEVRVGVDTDASGEADSWSEWRQIEETYDSIEGYSKEVKCTPATLDLRDLPPGYGFSIQLRAFADPKTNYRAALDRGTLNLSTD